MTIDSKTYDTKFNAKRGAQRSGLKPGEFEAFKTSDGRFGWRAVAKSPEPVVQMAVESESVGIANLTSESSPIAAANAASWPSGPKTGKRKAIVEQAQAGSLPAPPDFSKPTHARFRAKLAKLVVLAKAGDVEGLKAVTINPVSTSPKAIARYRDLAIVAMEARTANKR